MKWLLALILSGCAVPSKTEGFCFPKWVIRGLLSAFPLAFVVTSNAQEMTQSEVHVRCKDMQGTSVCLIREADLDDVIAANNRLGEALAEALKQIEAAKKPRCAEVEVVPKKKIPPIKRENNI